ncbi:MAG: bifunctional precorrin-2 dehydrogenase/sirohydrochlorin ferrochelatase [Thermodesulfovibrionales bacterium]|nr:bifunctional precorrin-2 dehydrogenase/sirohydrochlorin ferrochelatase [Thermodesulfovibrionales bacterium]
MYYPVFINLKGKECVVIGGGKVAQRKINSLLKAGASVTVISPEVTEGIEKLVRSGKIKLIKRPYKKGDLKKAFLVIAASSSKEVHESIARNFRGLLNVVDEPELCNFIVPSVIRRGPLIIAISTSGASPAMAKAIRKEMEKLYTKEFGRYLQLLKKNRKKLLDLPLAKRKRIISRFSSRHILKALREKRAESIIKDLLDELSLMGR